MGSVADLPGKETRVETTQRIVPNQDIDIAVYESGDPTAQTVVLVHGWPDTHHLWDSVVPLLSDRFHVVSYDTRGHGATTDPPGVRPFHLAELASDFRAVADAVSPDRPVHVLAHDWGSIQVWEQVCEPGAEQRIASFTSVSGPNLDHMGKWVRSRLSRPTPGNLSGPLRQLLASSYTAFFQAPVLPRLLFSFVDARRWQHFLELTEGIAPASVHLGATLEHDMVSGLRIYRANIVPLIRRPRERYTDVPVQLIVNVRDRAVLPDGYADEQRWASRLWRRDIPSGHWAPFSHPQLLARAVTELADVLDGGRPARDLRKAEVRPGKREFEDHLVVVTGWGSGIGRATALAFARAGADVVGCDVDGESGKETAALVAALGRDAQSYEVDVADPPQVESFADAVVAEHGVPDVLVNNAGVGAAGPFLDTPPGEFQRVLEINLGGVVNGCRAFAPHLVASGAGGHIVNLSSMAAFAPQRAMSAYSTSKAAVFAFSDCLRAELHGYGIGVSTICPGVVHTNIVATTRFAGVTPEEEAAQQQRFDRLYARRNYPPERVAEHILDAVRRGRAVVPVTPEARQAYWLSRFAPALTRRLARVNLLR